MKKLLLIAMTTLSPLMVVRGVQATPVVTITVSHTGYAEIVITTATDFGMSYLAASGYGTASQTGASGVAVDAQPLTSNDKLGAHSVFVTETGLTNRASSTSLVTQLGGSFAGDVKAVIYSAFVDTTSKAVSNQPLVTNPRRVDSTPGGIEPIGSVTLLAPGLGPISVPEPTSAASLAASLALFVISLVRSRQRMFG